MRTVLLLGAVNLLYLAGTTRADGPSGHLIGFHFDDFGHGPGNAVVTQSGADICTQAVRVDRTQPHAGVQFVNGQFMSTVVVGPENQGPVKLSNCGFWPVAKTGEQVVKLGQSTLMLTACHFALWDSSNKGLPCVRASGGRLCVSGCDYMAEGKQPIVLEPGLKAATKQIAINWRLQAIYFGTSRCNQSDAAKGRLQTAI